jgi:hypothetical protein
LAANSASSWQVWVRRAALLCLLALAVRTTAAQAKLVAFEENGKWGYRTSSGRVAIKPQFELAHDFLPDGIAAVVDDHGWAYINEKAKILIRPFVFDNGPDYFKEGLARFVLDGKFGFFDQKGHVAIRPQFDFAFPFQKGLSAVCMDCKTDTHGEHAVVTGGRWGYINHQGALVIPLQFDDALPFEKGVAKVKLHGEWIVMDTSGHSVIGDRH